MHPITLDILPSPRQMPRSKLTAAALSALLAGCMPQAGREVPPWLQPQVQIESNEAPRGGRLHVNMRISGVAPDGLVMLRLVRKEGQVRIADVRVADAGRAATRRQAEPALDTGTTSAVSLSRSGAARFRPWLSSTAGRSRSAGAFSDAAVHSGALGGLDLAGVTIAPVPVQAGGGGAAMRVGMALLSAFEGAIFDWPRERLYLIVRRPLLIDGKEPIATRIEALSRRPEWSVGPLRTGVEASAMPQSRQIVVRTSDALPLTEIEIAGESMAALIDTGFSGDLFVRRGGPWPLGPGASRSAIDVGGAKRPVREHALLAPLKLAGMHYQAITVTTSPTFPPGEQGAFEAVIGLGVLTRTPIWLDWNTGVMRIWSGTAEFPDLAPLP